MFLVDGGRRVGHEVGRRSCLRERRDAAKTLLAGEHHDDAVEAHGLDLGIVDGFDLALHVLNVGARDEGVGELGFSGTANESISSIL